MREWAVSGALVNNTDGLLLVENRRRDGRSDWSPPGGVVDPGESFVGALTREVQEETGLVVCEWSPCRYRVDVAFLDADMHLVVEVYEAITWQGDIVVDDPDGIVETATFCDHAHGRTLLETSPAWVQDPVNTWLDDRWDDERTFRFEVRGRSAAEMRAKRL